MKTKLTILTLALLMIAAASAAPMSHTVYTPLVQRGICPACTPRPTPTPRMWTHWGEDQP